MPIYEFVCKRCNAEFEELVRGTSKPACPQCAGEQLVRKLSVIATPASTKSASTGPCLPLPGGGCGLPRCGMGGCQN